MVVVRVLVVLLGLLLLAGGGRNAWVLAQPPPSPAQRSEQARFLEDALAAGHAGQAQQLFPEGEFFLHTLSGLATAADATRPATERLALVRDRLAAIDAPAVTGRFGEPGGVPHGIFYQGWRLLLATETVKLGGDPDDALALRRDARAILDAVAADPSHSVPSYPGQRWPVDTVVALGAVARAATVIDLPGAQEDLAAWVNATAALRDAHRGLYPHRVDRSGQAQEGPRGSSASLIAVFLPDIDPAGAREHTEAFRRAFLTRELGLVGVREYPHGSAGQGDVDSGALILGVSLSASAVGVATARSAGAAGLSADLDQEAELFGLPWSREGRRAFAAGVMPIGDAFVAWARSEPLRRGAVAIDEPRAVLWPYAAAPLGLGAALVGAVLLGRRARSVPPGWTPPAGPATTINSGP